MAERTVLYLKFANGAGKESSVSIANPKPGITLAEAKDVAQVITENGALAGADNTPLVSFIKAYTVVTHTEDLV